MKTIRECKRCKKTWVSYKTEKPKACGKCKSQAWDKYKKYEALHNIKIGEEIIMAWNIDEKGYPDIKKNEAMNRAVLRVEQKLGGNLIRITTPRGMQVFRVS